MRLESEPPASQFRTTYGLEVNPFDLGLETLPGTRSTEEAASVARELALRLGEHSAIVDVYLLSLSKVPAHHLRFLQMRGTRIVFAPTIAVALESDWATNRRGRSLTTAEVSEARKRYSREADTAAIYEPDLDIIVFPTTWTSNAVDQVVIHEVGHALTFHQAEARPGLLADLPPELARHVSNPQYGAEHDAGTLHRRCLEALAEAYVYLVVGREDRLPASLLSELVFILTAVAESDDKIRLDFIDDESSALRVRKGSTIGPEHPKLGWLFAPKEAANGNLDPHDIVDDELSGRRLRRRLG